tara:strand:- start:131 stop:403 length:273 start_codon:yes stop_codon:yes gene_type:complete
MRKFSKIMKDNSDKTFFGVLSGLSLYFNNLNVILIRSIFLLISIFLVKYDLGFEFFIFYCSLSVIIPDYDSKYDSFANSKTSGDGTEEHF